MFMEISGHEFWSRDGKSIWYDWQLPKGRTYFLASYNVETHHRTAYGLTPNQCPFTSTGPTTDHLRGDGGDSGQVTQAPDGTWVELYHTDISPARRRQLARPRPARRPAQRAPGQHGQPELQIGAERTFLARRQRIFFTSNMLGPSYVFSVDVAKARV